MRRRSADEVVFIVDECAGSNVAKGIETAGGKALLVSDLFGQGTPDVDWIPLAHEWGSAIVTRDIATRRNAAESRALELCDCHVFILRGGGLTFDELQSLMKQHHAAMVRYVLKYATPFIAHITSKAINVHVDNGRWADQKK